MLLKTKNDLSEKIRDQVSNLLNQHLVNAIDLQYQAKQAHWNVKGLQFKSLHELFDEVSSTAQKYSDLFAERAVQLGRVVIGTIRAAAQNSTLPEYPLELLRAIEHIHELSDRVASFSKACREAIDQSQQIGDQATADIFTDAVKDFDKLTWMLEAYMTDFDEIAAQIGRSRPSTKVASAQASH